MMLQSRVLTPGFKLFGGIATVAFMGAYVFGVGSNFANSDQGLIDSVVGPLTLGWKGGVGSQLGYALLLGTAAGAGVLAAMVLAFRDADPESQAEVTHVEVRPLTSTPHGSSYAPIALALAGVGLLIGLAASTPLALASAFVIAATALVWTTRAWANRATDDDVTNAAMYERLMEPWRVPVMSLVVVAIVILGVSRLLLATTKTGSVVVFVLIAIAFFGITAVIASRPRMSRNALTVLILITVLIVLGSAIAGLVVGQREFKNYAEYHSSIGASPSGLVLPTGDTTGESA
jgi:hypothetical protein